MQLCLAALHLVAVELQLFSSALYRVLVDLYLFLAVETWFHLLVYVSIIIVLLLACLFGRGFFFIDICVPLYPFQGSLAAFHRFLVTGTHSFLVVFYLQMYLSIF